MSNINNSYPVQVQSLLDQMSSINPSPEALALFRSLRSDQDAHEEGSRIHSAAVLDELLRIAAPSLPFVKASKIPGYGPMRLKYLLELGLELATHVHGHDEAMAKAAGAGVVKTTNLKGSRSLRRTALRVLKNLAGQDEAALARIEEAASEAKEKPDERARGLDALASEVEAAAAKLPPDIAADMGLTPELIAGLRQNAKAVLGARDSAKETRGDIASRYDLMNLLDGRILFELRALLRAMRDARKNDPTVPRLKAGRVQRSGSTPKLVVPPPAAPEPK